MAFREKKNINKNKHNVYVDDVINLFCDVFNGEMVYSVSIYKSS